jgi:urease accessory protein
MPTINKIIPAGRGLAAALLRRAASVELDWDVRQRSRFEATDSDGAALQVFLPRGVVVRGGDVLVADDGSLRVVRAAAQSVLLVRPCAEHGSPHDLLRAAYHLGNRHVQLELRADCVLLEPDHVLAEMLRRMHLDVSPAEMPFEPEAGAYAAEGASHRHEHAHDHAHGHAGGPEDPAHGDPHPHAHETAPGGPERHEQAHGHHERMTGPLPGDTDPGAVATARIASGLGDVER